MMFYTPEMGSHLNEYLGKWIDEVFFHMIGYEQVRGMTM